MRPNYLTFPFSFGPLALPNLRLHWRPIAAEWRRTQRTLGRVPLVLRALNLRSSRLLPPPFQPPGRNTLHIRIFSQRAAKPLGLLTGPMAAVYIQGKLKTKASTLRETDSDTHTPIHTYEHMYLYIYEHMRIYAYVRKHVHVHIDVHVHVHEHVFSNILFVHVYMCCVYNHLPVLQVPNPQAGALVHLPSPGMCISCADSGTPKGQRRFAFVPHHVAALRELLSMHTGQ